jgi:hypothetical protein
MPEEPLNEGQQPEPTPHFDAFSDHNGAAEPNVQQTPGLAPKPESGPVSMSEAPNTPTPVQDGPMTTFAPNPVISPEMSRVPEAVNIQPITPTMSSEKPKWFKQKKFIIATILALLIVVLAGGSVFAYNNYQKPQKVISDSIINAITAKSAIYLGTLDVNNKDVKVGVKISSKQSGATGSLDADLTVTASGKTYKISGSGLIDNSGDLYFKVEHLAGVVAEAKTSIGITQNSSASIAIDKLVAKIDGTWVKISSDDLKQYSEDTAASKTCINETVKIQGRQSCYQ